MQNRNPSNAKDAKTVSAHPPIDISSRQSLIADKSAPCSIKLIRMCPLRPRTSRGERNAIDSDRVANIAASMASISHQTSEGHLNGETVLSAVASDNDADVFVCARERGAVCVYLVALERAHGGVVQDAEGLGVGAGAVAAGYAACSWSEVVCLLGCARD